MNTPPKHIIIVGGGITGLSAAWYLQKSTASHPLRITVLEASDRWGGKLYTEQVASGDHASNDHASNDHASDDHAAPFILEWGADAFLTRKPGALELAHDLGLSHRIQPVNAFEHNTYILHHGQPVPLPDGLSLLVPTNLNAFFRSPLFSLVGKLRAALDLIIPPRRSETDESLASFVRRRLGAEMLDKLGEPLLAGVYNGDSERQSMLATFPQFPVLEKQYGSLIRGMNRKRRTSSADSEPPFFSFKSGVHELINALAYQINGDLRLNSQVERITITHTTDDTYTIQTSQGEVLSADALILATPAHITTQLVSEIAPQAAEHLRAIPYSSIGTAYIAYHRQDVPHPLNGLGLVIPTSERQHIDGVTWSSSKWANRSPADRALLRVFFGGSRRSDTINLPDDVLLNDIRAELKSIFGITAPPIFHRIYRWIDAYPQYNLGHLEHVSSAETALPHKIIIAGSAYRGIGVPDCIHQAQNAASRVITSLFGVNSQSHIFAHQETPHEHQ